MLIVFKKPNKNDDIFDKSTKEEVES